MVFHPLLWEVLQKSNIQCIALIGGVEDDAGDVDVVGPDDNGLGGADADDHRGVGADDDDHCGVVRDNCLLHKCSCPSSTQPVNVDFDKKVGF